MINLFKVIASNRTFGNPSNTEDKIKTSDDLIRLYGLLVNLLIFTIFSRLLFSI